MPDEQGEPKLGNLTLIFATGNREEILVTPEDHNRALAAMNAGEPISVTTHNYRGDEVGLYEAAPGAVVAMHFR